MMRPLKLVQIEFEPLLIQVEQPGCIITIDAQVMQQPVIQTQLIRRLVGEPGHKFSNRAFDLVHVD